MDNLDYQSLKDRIFHRKKIGADCAELERKALEYRRANNIFEVGDKAVHIPSGGLVTVAEQEFSMNYIFIDFPDGDFIDCLYSDVRHVELEVLNDIDIPPNTIILGDK